MGKVFGVLLCSMVVFLFSRDCYAQDFRELEDLLSEILLSEEFEKDTSAEAQQFSKEQKAFKAKFDQLEDHQLAKELEVLEKKFEEIQNQIEKKSHNLNRLFRADLTKGLEMKLSQLIKEDTEASAKRVLKFLPEYSKFLATISQVEKWVLLEGIPRNKKSILHTDQKDSKQIEIGGFQFYEKPLKSKAMDLQLFKSILMSHQNLQPHQGKFCGGFHPDIAVQLVDQVKETHTILICLGCAEVRWLTANKVVEFDLHLDAHTKIVRFAKMVCFRRDWKRRKRSRGSF